MLRQDASFQSTEMVTYVLARCPVYDHIVKVSISSVSDAIQRNSASTCTSPASDA